MNRCQLVMIEWEDSAQPTPGWDYLTNFVKPDAVRCVSVGWLIHDGDDVKALAPNMGGVESEANVQVSGIIRIPARCIVRIERLKEPRLTSCAASAGLSSRPGPAPSPQAS